jgi:glycosyltransferase involved in cell wall biosynthesis
LQLGLIWEHRLSVELAAAAQGFPEGWVLVMHGYGEPPCIEAVRRADTRHRTLLSLTMVPYGDLPQIVASARVGLVLYGAWPENDRLTARSSEKLAMFLRAGVPVIAFDYPGYEVITSYDCGVLIGDLGELSAALETVDARREEMSANACTCFSDEYEFTHVVKPTLAVVADLTRRRRGT